MIALLAACGDESAPAADGIGDGENPAEENLTENTEGSLAQLQEQEEAQPCPSIANFGHAYQTPCQLALNIKHETRGLRAFQRSDRQLSSEYTLTVTGELGQLYPPPFFVPAVHESGSNQRAAFQEFTGQAHVVGETFRSPAHPVAIDRFKLETGGSHPTRIEYQGEFSGPVTSFLIERFEPRLDDPSSLCISAGMTMTVTGVGTTRHTRDDGTTVEASAGPRGEGFTNHSNPGEWVWSRNNSGFGPHAIIACEGSPPIGTSPDCESDPRSYYGNEVCASEHLVVCSGGDCQVDFGRGGWMIWYGLTANEDRSRWELNGEVSISDPHILKMQDAETTWSLDLDLFVVPQTLKYE